MSLSNAECGNGACNCFSVHASSSILGNTAGLNVGGHSDEVLDMLWTFCKDIVRQILPTKSQDIVDRRVLK